MEEQFPEVVGKTHYEKLLNALDRRELRDFRSTKGFIMPLSRSGLNRACFLWIDMGSMCVVL